MSFRRIAALLLAASLALPAAAQDEALTPAQKAAVEATIRQYLLDHPELILEAVQGLQARKEEEAAAAQRKAVAQYRDQLFRDPSVPAIGNPAGDVTLVEFFDYQCGYCKSVLPALRQLLDDDGKVRLVLREMPILGPASLTASKAALAAKRQGKYEKVHFALMGHRGQLDDDTILRIAAAAGADMDQLRRDMESPEVRAEIERSMELARALNINGTPAFVIGEELIPGAVPLAALKQKVAETRAGG
ncbi:MAG TPA: DsbA family protein [Alphaproteobacteria bacterium]|nr:DsbA family protein [Alphaproteobacteria bacterium]